MNERAGKQNGARPSRTVSPARVCALDALRRVEEDAAFASVLLATSVDGLQTNDRALCYEIVLGCLRWQLWLDRCLAHFSGREPAKLDAEVRRALRAGLYQLRFLTRIPASAVVNETVAHVRGAGFASAAGFANAVLRRAAREPEFDPAANITDDFERISVASSHPRWMIERWSRSFGIAEAEALAHSNNRPSAVAFRLNALHTEAATTLDDLKAAGGFLTPSPIVTGAWRIKGAGAKVRQLESVGVIYLQSEASQLVGNLLEPQAHERILDACAAPGSKTSHIAMLAGDAALLVAGDVHHHRLRLLCRLVGRQSIQSINPVTLDAELALPFRNETFHRVLVDAPCTGTGTLRHNPEIRWRLSAADTTTLAGTQSRILSEAARTVAGGGRLVYSTCSVEPEENEGVVAEFLRRHEEWQINQIPVPENLRTETGAARTFSHRHDTDGFFVQVFEKSNK